MKVVHRTSTVIRLIWSAVQITFWFRSCHVVPAGPGDRFRASELAILKPESFDLSASPPVVHLQARSSKNRNQPFNLFQSIWRAI
ncbi:MAG: hypothetical protein R3B84_11115 [Zavarzinella sp.]